MKNFSTLLVSLIAAILLPAQVFAQNQCDAYFPLDGNLADSSGSGIVGTMIGKEGALATPDFVDGKVGRALRLDGTSAMRAFVDLNYESCSQVTMTAWVMFEPARSKGTVNIISTGGGSGPGLTSSGPTLTLKGTANGLMQSNAIRENAGWMFVAGVYDYAGDQYTLYWRGRSESRPLGPNRRVPEEAIWIGALNDGLSGAASGVVVDELRIYGRLLTEDELNGMQALRVPDFESTSPVQQAALASCASQADCAAGSYCAFDRTCHPESHLPMQQIEMTVLPAPVQTITTVNSGGSASSSSSGIPKAVPGVSGALPANNGIDTGAIEARLAESRPPEIGYASEEEALAAAERREREAYEAELARQQNEFERQRREAAAAEESASSSSSESTSGTVTGWRLSATDVKQTLVSGTQGEIIKVMDIETEALTGIRIVEPTDVPCFIAVFGSDADNSAINLDQCTQIVWPQIVSFENKAKIAPAAITALRVCHSFQNNDRIKGIVVSGNIMNEDGSPGFYQQAKDDGPNCHESGWKQIVACDVGYVASGVVAHFKDRDFGDSLTGVALICRRIEKIYQ